MNEQELLKILCKKEIQYGLYSYKIDGISIYSVIRHIVRSEFLIRNGAPQSVSQHKYNKIKALMSGLKSAYHIIQIMMCGKKCSTVYIPWVRYDFINGVYLEKHLDSFIEQIDLKGDYIIFDHGQGGVHPTPRMHSDKIVYSEFIQIIGEIASILFYPFYFLFFKEEFSSLRKAIHNALGEDWNWKVLERYFIVEHIGSKIFFLLFRLLKTKRLVGIPRSSIVSSIIAARKMGLLVFELQHGITFAESRLYSGYRDKMFVPDYFFAFGDNKPLDVYGIEESRIINVGWALGDFLSQQVSSHQYGKNDILVISEAEVTDKIITAVIKLSEGNPDCNFYIRPHPVETFSKEQLDLISSKNNVFINDKTENIYAVLQGFTHIIGENSTVLYEALAVRKKVARLYLSGLSPLFLEKDDVKLFWHIYNQNDFRIYLEDDVSIKTDKSIYSKFNKEKALAYFDLI